MIKIVVFFVTCLITATMTFSYSQVGFSTDNSLPDNSAILDVKSTSKGLLPPRMSFTARRAILNPAAGLVVFCTDGNPDGTGTLSIFQGGHWLSLHGECTCLLRPPMVIRFPRIPRSSGNGQRFRSPPDTNGIQPATSPPPPTWVLPPFLQKQD